MQRNPCESQTAAQAAATAANTSTITTAFRNETRLTAVRRPTVAEARCALADRL